MPLRSKSFEKITLSDLQSLVDNEVFESKYIEYKQSLPGNADAEKREFLRDVSSFANAAGGDLIYGIREEDRIPAEVCGVDIQDIDGARLRLEDIIRYGIEPRIPGVVIHPIVEGERKVILVRVPKSWTSPHVVKFKEWKFYTRDSSGKRPLDVQELRAAFLLSNSMGERIRRFRSERLGSIVAGETPVCMPTSAKVVLHIVPFASVTPGMFMDISDVKKLLGSMIPIHSSRHNHRHNFDGLVTNNTFDNFSISYVQLFRNGMIEAVNASLLGCPPYTTVQDSHMDILIGEFEDSLIDSLANYLRVLKMLGMDPPAFIMLSLLGVKGYGMKLRSSRQMSMQIERNDLIVPEVILEDFDMGSAQILKPCFDSIWNACGYARSFNYDEQGKWAPRH